jgi:predicted AlkP superfamily phosphohydrolase/phosphomutase
MPTTDRLLVLGLDGATWNVLDPMRRRGRMPNLDALLMDSARGTLRSSVPPMTAAAWATMQTGCGPARHGIFDHRYYDAASGRMKVNHAARIRVPTTWQILSEAGRSIISLNLPGTFPAPAGVRGIVVSGMDAPHLDAATKSCPAFAARLKALVPDYSLKYFWKRAPQSLDELQENARQTVNSFRGRAEGGLLADRAQADWSVLMVQFQNLDPFQHRAWRHLNVDETGINDPPWNAAAETVLEGLDTAIGRLVELADRRGAAVLVVSDHGFGPCRGRIHANRILVDAGVARMPGTGGQILRRARQGLDHLRIWSAKRDDPEARSASFDLSVTAQFPFDWKRTLAFAPHQDTAAMVYLNRAGARLTTPRQLDDARNAAALALGEARHPETNTPLFPTVICMAEAHNLDPAEMGYPDLLALPDEAYWVRTKLSPGSDWIEPDPNPPGPTALRGSSPCEPPESIPAGPSPPASTTSPRPSSPCSTYRSRAIWKGPPCPASPTDQPPATTSRPKSCKAPTSPSTSTPTRNTPSSSNGSPTSDTSSREGATSSGAKALRQGQISDHAPDDRCGGHLIFVGPSAPGGRLPQLPLPRINTKTIPYPSSASRSVGGFLYALGLTSIALALPGVWPGRVEAILVRGRGDVAAEVGVAMQAGCDAIGVTACAGVPGVVPVAEHGRPHPGDRRVVRATMGRRARVERRAMIAVEHDAGPRRYRQGGRDRHEEDDGSVAAGRLMISGRHGCAAPHDVTAVARTHATGFGRAPGSALRNRGDQWPESPSGRRHPDDRRNWTWRDRPDRFSGTRSAGWTDRSVASALDPTTGPIERGEAGCSVLDFGGQSEAARSA